MPHYRLLAIEPDPQAALTLANALELCNLASDICRDSGAAVGAAEANPPDILLIAYDIPEGSLQANDRLRAVPGCADLPLVLSHGGEVDEAMQCEALLYGALAWVRRPYSDFEVQLAVTTMLKIRLMQGELQERVSELDRLASTDALTGLYNRRHIIGVLQQELVSARRRGRPFALGMADLDHFKAVNDTHGHAAGDAVLVEVAQAMRSALRAGDSLGRIGGEEFMFLLPGASLEAAARACERLRGRVEGLAVGCGELTLRPTISVGLAALDGKLEVGAERLMQLADAALYQSKAAGRNRLTIAGPPDPGSA